MSNSNFHFQNDQGYNSRGNQNYEGFDQDSSYRFQNNDRDVEKKSSPSSIYTKYLQLQICMLKQTASLQGPSINSDECSATHPSRTTKPKIRILGIVVRERCVALHEFSASQSCSSNSSQLG